MRGSRLLLSSLALPLLLACPGPVETPDAGTPPPPPGNNNNNTPPPDPALGKATLESDGGLSFRVRSTVLAMHESPQALYLFESALGKDLYCDGVSPEQRVLQLMSSAPLEPDSLHSLPGVASLRIEGTDGGTIMANSGSFYVAPDSLPFTTVSGNFAVENFQQGALAREGSMTGTFEAHNCPPGAYFDGGTGPNTASGQLGFPVRSTIGRVSGSQYVVFLFDKDVRAQVCNAQNPIAPFKGVQVQFNRSTAGASQTFPHLGFQVGYFDYDAAGTSQGPTGYINSALTVAYHADGGFSGSYEMLFIGENGSHDLVEGRFDPTYCP